jgi:thiol-disulfide isomerase/thioredoxin
MSRIKYFVLLLLFLPVSFTALSQNIKNIDTEGLQKILNNQSDKLFVINFWASWCPPCVKELPGFFEVQKALKPENVEFIFVSLDFPSQRETALKQFLEKSGYRGDVYLVTETDADKWIEKVDPKWQGNIPTTLFLNNKKKIRKFHEGELTETELYSIIKSLV